MINWLKKKLERYSYSNYTSASIYMSPGDTLKVLINQKQIGLYRATTISEVIWISGVMYYTGDLVIDE